MSKEKCHSCGALEQYSGQHVIVMSGFLFDRYECPACSLKKTVADTLTLLSAKEAFEKFQVTHGTWGKCPACNQSGWFYLGVVQKVTTQIWFNVDDQIWQCFRCWRK